MQAKLDELLRGRAQRALLCGISHVTNRLSARDLGHISTNYRTQNEMFMLTAFNHR